MPVLVHRYRHKLQFRPACYRRSGDPGLREICIVWQNRQHLYEPVLDRLLVRAPEPVGDHLYRVQWRPGGRERRYLRGVPVPAADISRMERHRNHLPCIGGTGRVYISRILGRNGGRLKRPHWFSLRSRPSRSGRSPPRAPRRPRQPGAGS